MKGLWTKEVLTIPASWQGPIDIHKQFSERWQAMDLVESQIHRLLGQFDLHLIDGGHQADYGMAAFQGHGSGILDHRLHRIKQGSIPVLFDRVVCDCDREEMRPGRP